jgi:hypothetical protein
VFIIVKVLRQEPHLGFYFPTWQENYAYFFYENKTVFPAKETLEKKDLTSFFLKEKTSENQNLFSSHVFFLHFF